MRAVLLLAVAVAAFPAAAADIEAGKAKAESVCAACHGANGVSVSESIPNLAAQRAGYIVEQLKALKDGSRKAPIMNPIAAQLSPEDMANVAAYFASLPGAPAAAKSSFMPAVANTRVKFPEGFHETFVRYHVIDSPEKKQVSVFYANRTAAEAARAGHELPDGSVLLFEVYAAKLDDAKQPVKDAQGRLVPEKLLAHAVMEREVGWGDAVPAMLRNGNWNYAAFRPDKQPIAAANLAECFACHKPQEKASFAFTLPQLAQSR